MNITITVRLFATLKEITGQESLELEFDGEPTVEELMRRVAERVPEIKEVLETRRVFISINQEMAQKNDIVKDGDEVALLPPFSGGK